MKTKTNTLLGAVLFLLGAALALPPVALAQAANTVVAWGACGQCIVPSPNRDFVAVAGGVAHSLGLKANGKLVAWGSNSDGQLNLPKPNSGFVAVAAGYTFSLGLKSDGSIKAWGQNNFGQTNVPAPNSGFVAIAAGINGHSLGLKSNGTVVAWGNNDSGQCNIPAPNGGYVAIAAGANFSLVSRRTARSSGGEPTLTVRATLRRRTAASSRLQPVRNLVSA